MRRWLAAPVTALVLAVAGCSLPPGIDGDLANGWATPPAATGFTPAAGTCHTTLERTGFLASYNPVACTQRHKLETYHVGTYTGAVAAAKTAPSPSTGGGAYADCSRRADAFVGGSWRGAALTIGVTVPSQDGWDGGARWYRCDIGETDADNGGIVARQAGLKDALRGAAPLAFRCFGPQKTVDGRTTQPRLPCTRRHTTEYVGLWTAPKSRSYAAVHADEAALGRGCRGVIAAYTKVPDDGMLKYRTGWAALMPSEAEWGYGERGVRCFLYLQDWPRRSLKGAGTKGLPVHYA